MEQKKERLLTPVGEAKWAHVHTPKAPYKDNQKAKYQIDVVFDDKDPDWKKWASDLMQQIKNLPEQRSKTTGDVIPKQIPIKKELNEKDEPTGRYYVTFKTGETFKPGVFDIFGAVIPENVLIGNGSKVVVSYTPAIYDTFGGGIALYLNAVQVRELVEYKQQQASSYGFETVEKEEEKPIDSLPF